MEKMSLYMFTAGFLTVLMSAVLYLAYSVMAISGRTRLAAAGVRGETVTANLSPRALGAVGRVATIFAWNGVVFLFFSLLFRSIVSGIGPFSNMYQFSLAFALGVSFAYLIAEARSGLRVLGSLVMPVALGMLWYASTVPNDIGPLVPALQNNLLLTVHVSVAIVAYGFFAVSFGAAVLYLIRQATGASEAALDSLDETAYKAVIVGFPAMALVILLGSIWAETAWGRWWGWDPKETASLFTFLLYAGYMHARIFRGWKGRRSAVLLVLGFIAVLFTYFGNLFFAGLHSYSGLN